MSCTGQSSGGKVHATKEPAMKPLRLLFIAIAFGTLYYFLPPLLVNPGPITACLLAVGYLGFVLGEMIEFLLDRYHVAKRL
jgi:hypothetical protein